ncbi:MAG: hypothetical protein IJ518_05430 [Clostridia bacterium]|nr:hypothetical protein [Clostridia bacterium]
MKRWIHTLAVMITLAICFTGCTAGGNHAGIKPVTADFSCEAVIHYRELELEADLTRQTDGKLILAFSRPNSLSGITLGWDGTDMTMELGGMSLSLAADKVPESALIRCLLQVLAAAHPAGAETEEGYTVSGEAEGLAYVLVCDPATGLPLSLTVPEQELTATFTDSERLPLT